MRLNTETNSAASSPPRSSSEESETQPNSSRIHLHPPTPSPSVGASPMLVAGSSTRSSSSYVASSSGSSSSSSIGSPPPVDAPSPLALSPVETAGDNGYDLASLLSSVYPDGTGLDSNIGSLFDGLIRHDHLNLSNADSCLMHHERGHCGCLSDSASYSVVLELSLRLRRAAEVLSHDAKHRAASSNCPIHQRITDLDRRARCV
jgi:hypothetical protein